MIQKSHNEEQVLAQLKAQTEVYIELPFNTGDFLVIAHYKLIAHYRHVLRLFGPEGPDPGLLKEHAEKRKELQEEILFQLGKILALTSLSEEQLEKLRSFKAFHEQLLHEATT